ncbi:MAG: hypothetical protein WKG07_30925 [Hymenobacter sp.]
MDSTAPRAEAPTISGSNVNWILRPILAPGQGSAAKWTCSKPAAPPRKPPSAAPSITRRFGIIGGMVIVADC